MCYCSYDHLQHNVVHVAAVVYHVNCTLLPLTYIAADFSHSALCGLQRQCFTTFISALSYLIVMLHALQAARPPPHQAAAHLPLSPVYKSSCEQFARPLEEPQV